MAQLGEMPWQKVLDAVMEGPNWGTLQGELAVLLVEINLGVGNLCEASLTRKNGTRMPTHYVAIADSDMRLEWLERTTVDALRHKHFNGELVVPGHVQPSKEMRLELVEAPLAPPALSKRVVPLNAEGSSKRPQLGVPKA